MSVSEIRVQNRAITLHKSYSAPDFKAKTAHVSNRFQYVDMWLRQMSENGGEALVFWRQASNFYKANSVVDELAKPLTSYYCLLNMVKALLVSKGKQMKRVQHGVTGYATGSKTALSNEYVKFKFSGVLPELSRFYNENVSGSDEHNLHDLLYNLPHIHRAYCLTIPSRSKKELFIPMINSGFYKVDGSSESYFRGYLTKGWNTSYTKRKLPSGFEIDVNTDENELSIRKKKRFRWSGRSEKEKIKNLSDYHKKIRKGIFHIYDAPGYWYLKRDAKGGVSDGLIDKNPTVISFAAMHRLSELSRYDPDKLQRHFKNRYGWLLSEFLARTLDQVLDDLTSEITGSEVN